MSLNRKAARCSLHRLVRPLRVIMFQPQFASMVASAEKLQTIRRLRKRPVRVGDRLSLRAWTGAPYRSQQRVLRESVADCVLSVSISSDGMIVGGRKLTPAEEWKFARVDGFSTPQDMLDWFNFTHGLPFEGAAISWPNETKISDSGRGGAWPGVKVF